MERQQLLTCKDDKIFLGERALGKPGKVVVEIMIVVSQIGRYIGLVALMDFTCSRQLLVMLEFLFIGFLLKVSVVPT